MPVARSRAGTTRRRHRLVLEPSASIVWLTGDHEGGTVQRKRLTLADLLALDEHDVVVDLSETTALSAAAIDELDGARRYLAGRLRRFAVRGAPPSIEHAFAERGAMHLLEPTLLAAVVLQGGGRRRPTRGAKVAGAVTIAGLGVANLVMFVVR